MKTYVSRTKAMARRGWSGITSTRLSQPALHAPVAALLLVAFFALQGPGSYAAYAGLAVLIYAIAAWGLNIPAGFSGALSLGQGASFALGAYVVANLTVNHQLPFWLTLPAAAAAGVVLGMAMGLPAGRLGEIGLALVSLGAVLVSVDMLIELDGLTGGVAGLSPVVLISHFGAAPTYHPWALPALVTVSALFAYLLHYMIRVSRLGRSAMASRDEPIGAMSLGISGYWSKVATFSLGSGFGAYAGGLFAFMAQYISPDAFTIQLSIILLAMVVLGGPGSTIGPLLGAAVLTILPLELGAYPHVNSLIYGATLIAVVLWRPRGLVAKTAAPVRDRLVIEHDPQSGVEEFDDSIGGVVLEVSNVSRAFGGVKALNDVSMTVRKGEVVALIGPNGSGKTTLLNVVTGMYPADAGEVALDGDRITHARPRSLSSKGIARTFQTPKTFPSLSVAEHLALSHDQHRGRRAVDAGFDAWVGRLLALGGIDATSAADLAREARSLGHGQLRFLEIAMAVRNRPKLLLLDEPAAGLSPIEMEGLERVTRQLANLGIGVIVVEHHMDMVQRLADRVVVLDLGGVIWEGAPGDLRDAAAVKQAYLGGIS